MKTRVHSGTRLVSISLHVLRLHRQPVILLYLETRLDRLCDVNLETFDGARQDHSCTLADVGILKLEHTFMSVIRDFI